MRVDDSVCREFCNRSYHQHYGTFLEQNTSDIIFTVITSAFIVGGMLGAMLGGLVADKLGRKKGLILSQGDIARLCSHWSSSYITALSLVESFIVMLCPKEPAHGTQSGLLLVLYGIRVASMQRNVLL